MRILQIICRGVMISSLAVVPACALEGDVDPPSGQSSDETPESSDQNGAAPSTNSVESDITATPTCDWVAAFAGAWVPEYRPTNTVDCNMVVGCNSPGVKQLQHSMNLCYGEHLVEDGDFGGRTRDALIRTQGKAGTRADGEYGPNTRKAMFHERIGGGCIRVP